MTMTRLLCTALLVGEILWLTGCATARPILYPDQTLQARGSQAAQEDIDACMAKAKRYGANSSQAGRIAKDTAENGAAGGAAGAAGGAVFGNAGQGAAAGAAVGAAEGLVHSLFSSGRHSRAYKRFVDQCLRDKGYQPIGWK